MKKSVNKKLPVILALSAAAVVIAAVCIVGVLLSQKDYDTVKDNENSSKAVSSQKAPQSSASSDSAYAAIKVTNGFNDESFDPVFYTKRLYELKSQFGIDAFDSVSDLSVSAVVQLAFCHIYYDSLTEMPDEKNMLFRQVLPESISEKITELFGKNNVDVSKSDLYNKDSGLVEMWQPKLGAMVYANVSCDKTGDGQYTLTATFFKEEDKTQKDSTVTGVFEKQGDGYIIKSMKTQ